MSKEAVILAVTETVAIPFLKKLWTKIKTVLQGFLRKNRKLITEKVQKSIQDPFQEFKDEEKRNKIIRRLIGPALSVISFGGLYFTGALEVLFPWDVFGFPLYLWIYTTLIAIQLPTALIFAINDKYKKKRGTILRKWNPITSLITQKEVNNELLLEMPAVQDICSELDLNLQRIPDLIPILKTYDTSKLQTIFDNLKLNYEENDTEEEGLLLLADELQCNGEENTLIESEDNPFDLSRLFSQPETEENTSDDEEEEDLFW